MLVILAQVDPAQQDLEVDSTQDQEEVHTPGLVVARTQDLEAGLIQVQEVGRIQVLEVGVTAALEAVILISGIDLIQTVSEIWQSVVYNLFVIVKWL